MNKLSRQDKRIIEILGAGDLEVTLESLTLYREYLRKNLEMPCVMTGIEDFPWEERYIFGFGDKAEYEEMKKTQASYKDVFELKRFEDLLDEDYGILVKVIRVKDNKRFVLDLASLKSRDRKSRNYMLLDDYVTWFDNNR